MNFRSLALATVVAFVLTACAGATSKQVRPVADDKGLSAEEIVARNATARWEAILAKDFRTAYGYLTSGTRAITTPEAYVKRMLGATIRWTGAKVESVECNEPDVCRAAVYITYMVRGAQAGMGEIEGGNPVFEQWIRGDDGRWYHLPGKTGG